MLLTGIMSHLASHNYSMSIYNHIRRKIDGVYYSKPTQLLNELTNAKSIENALFACDTKRRGGHVQTLRQYQKTRANAIYSMIIPSPSQALTGTTSPKSLLRFIRRPEIVRTPPPIQTKIDNLYMAYAMAKIACSLSSPLIS